VVNCKTRPLDSQGKKTPYPLNRRLGVAQSLSGRFGEEKNFLPLPEFEPRTVQLVAKSLYCEMILG